jgi:ectoine hydroxylase-related dioxygenase (phytanoyl-CoA dioxygenase family)
MIDPSSGFAIVPAVLDATEAAALAQTLSDGTLDRSRAGARHLMTHAAVANVAHDRRLLDIATAFLGAAPIPYRATLFDKSPHHNWLVVWHQDTALPLRERRDVPGWGPWSVKSGIVYAHAPAAALARVIALRLHLDDSRADNGPLRVLPGTHSQGLLSDGDVHRLVAKLTVTDCLAPAGGVVAMRPLILHASSKAESDRPRRVLHIEYADSLEIGAGLHLAVA